MKDGQFKKLVHNAAGYELLRPGGQIYPGYKPDIALKKGDEYIMMECDTGTTRKGFVGGMIKAAKISYR